MSRRAKGLLAAGAVVAAVGLVALYLSRPHFQARQAERRIQAAREAGIKLAQAIAAYSDGTGNVPAPENGAAVGPQKQEP